jgi:hypothetical protein
MELHIKTLDDSLIKEQSQALYSGGYVDKFESEAMGIGV